MAPPASDSGQNIATKVLSSRTPITIALACILIAAALWAQRVADDVSSIKTNLSEIVKDHEARIRVLEADSRNLTGQRKP